MNCIQRVLVVDDSEAAAEMLGLLVQRLGYEVRTAFDGMAAIHTATNFLPDVVIMDIGMPIMDGLEAAKRMRSAPWSPRLFLVALSGWDRKEDRALASDAGFDFHLVKPATSAELKQLFTDLESYSGDSVRML